MAIELLVIVVGAAGFFLLRGVWRKRLRDRRRDSNAQTKYAATPLPRAARERKEERRERKEERRERKEERREREEERREREAEDYANPLADPNAWNLDDANGLGAELQYVGVDPEDRDPEDR